MHETGTVEDYLTINTDIRNKAFNSDDSRGINSSIENTNSHNRNNQDKISLSKQLDKGQKIEKSQVVDISTKLSSFIGFINHENKHDYKELPLSNGKMIQHSSNNSFAIISSKHNFKQETLNIVIDQLQAVSYVDVLLQSGRLGFKLKKRNIQQSGRTNSKQYIMPSDTSKNKRSNYYKNYTTIDFTQINLTRDVVHEFLQYIDKKN